jgi:hypothetical protein
MKVIYFRESFLQSAASDVWTLGIIVCSLWFSHEFVGSNFLDGVLVFLLALWVLGRGTRKGSVFTDPEELRNHLADEFPGVFWREGPGDHLT